MSRRLGLSPLYVKENFKVIQQINELGMTVLLVEQNARQTLAIAHQGYVLTQGRVVAQGSAQALRENDEVRAAYLAECAGGSILETEAVDQYLDLPVRELVARMARRELRAETVPCRLLDRIPAQDDVIHAWQHVG